MTYICTLIRCNINGSWQTYHHVYIHQSAISVYKGAHRHSMYRATYRKINRKLFKSFKEQECHGLTGLRRSLLCSAFRKDREYWTGWAFLLQWVSSRKSRVPRSPVIINWTILILIFLFSAEGNTKLLPRGPDHSPVFFVLVSVHCSGFDLKFRVFCVFDSGFSSNVGGGLHAKEMVNWTRPVYFLFLVPHFWFQAATPASPSLDSSPPWSVLSAHSHMILSCWFHTERSSHPDLSYSIMSNN